MTLSAGIYNGSFQLAATVLDVIDKDGMNNFALTLCLGLMHHANVFDLFIFGSFMHSFFEFQLSALDLVSTLLRLAWR